jgi:hypothetical protein
MLLDLAPREIQKKNQVLVSNRETLVLGQQKIVTLGTARRSKGKDDLFQLFDKYPHGTAAFMKHETTQFGFTFFDKIGRRLCLNDNATLTSLRNMLNHHKRKNKKKRKDKDLFFHKMKTNNHQLSQGNTTKDNFRSQLDDIEKIEEQFLFPVWEELLYCARNIHQRPHGLAFSTDREESNKRLAHMEIPNIICNNRMTRCVDSSDYKVICPGAPEFGWLHNNVQVDKKRWVQYILEVNRVSDTVRDPGGNPTKAGSIYIGFGQSQSFGNDMQLCYHGSSWWKKCHDGSKVALQDDKKDRKDRKVPLLNIQYLEQMPIDLRIQLGRILAFGQVCLDSYYQKDEVKPFADKFRNSLFGNYLHSFFPEESISFRWEYIHITVKHYDAVLPKHMDYSNDKRKGYNHCVVYSFTIDGFRISFIMTSRRNCGSASDRIKKLMSSNNTP